MKRPERPLSAGLLKIARRREDLDATRILAESIALALFTNGSGQRAERLVLTVDGPPKRDLGGWAQRPAADVIERELRKAGK